MARKETTIMDAIKGADEMDQTKGAEQNAASTENAENSQPEEASSASWGGFKIETGITPPTRGGHGSTKYDWAAFPAPTNPEDPSTWPSVFIPNIGPKVISKSVKSYKERLAKANPEAVLPEFTVSTSKEPKGVRVFRKA